MSKIDLNRVWDDARAMGAANKDLLGAIAGMFVLLPSVVGNMLITPRPQPTGQDVPMEEMSRQILQFYTDNWAVLISLSLVVSFGLLAMLALLLRPDRLTVGESMKAAIMLLPGYFIASLLQGAAFGAGFMLFVLPGLYIYARLSLIAPAAAAEHLGGPVDQLRRSFELTRGNGWRIFMVLLILYITAEIVRLVAGTLVGLVGELLLPEDVAALATSIVAGLIAAGLSVFFALLSAAIYRAAQAPAPWQPN